MDDTPQWVEAIVDVLEGCSPGSFELQFSPVECQLIIAPSLAEIVGGAEDGEEVFPFFSMHLAALAQIFDALPEMSWDTMHDELHVEGEIDGEDAWITIRKFPFEEEASPRWVIAGGTIRRREEQD